MFEYSAKEGGAEPSLATAGSLAGALLSPLLTLRWGRMNEPDDPSWEDELESLGPNGRHLHPLAPLVFAVVGLAVGVLTAVVLSPALGVPLGLLGGGMGVWAVERGRRLR